VNITNLKSDIDFLCGSTSATYPDVDKVRNMNIAYLDVATVIWESDGSWHFDDSNNTDSALAYKTLAHTSATYLIPTTALQIKGVEIQNSTGSWTKLKTLIYEDLHVSPEEYLSTLGIPTHYQLEGNEIRLYPTPSSASVTLASGMLVRLNRAVTEIPLTASTYTPGFASPFHRILSLAASLDFTQDDSQRKFLITQKQRLEMNMEKFYERRGMELRTAIKPSNRRTWRNYI